MKLNRADLLQLIAEKLKMRIGVGIIYITSRYFRLAEVDWLIGNSKKAKEQLEWSSKTQSDKLVSIIVKADFEKEITKSIFVQKPNK